MAEIVINYESMRNPKRFMTIDAFEPSTRRSLLCSGSDDRGKLRKAVKTTTQWRTKPAKGKICDFALFSLDSLVSTWFRDYSAKRSA